MTSRRSFVRHGALWVVGAALVEPVHRTLWAFPQNPTVLSDEEYLARLLSATSVLVISWPECIRRLGQCLIEIEAGRTAHG